MCIENSGEEAILTSGFDPMSNNNNNKFFETIFGFCN